MGESLRILLVEDEERFRTMVARCLAAEGHEVMAADGVEAALEATGGRAPQMAIVDRNLGRGGDGLELARTLLERDPAIRLIGMSGERVEDEFLAAGARLFLCKPLHLEELVEAVRGLAREP